MTRGGLVVPVEGVADSGQEEVVYNWEVTDYHTYFVSASEVGVALWAHNYNPTPRVNGKPVTREQRWLDLAKQPNSKLPKQVKEHILRTGGKGVKEEFGLELAHRPKKSNAQGHDYSDAIPKLEVDHRGIEHAYLEERRTGTRIRIPRRRSNGPLSVPRPGSLPG